MSYCVSFPLPLNSPVFFHHRKLHVLSLLVPFSKHPFSLFLSKSHICFSSSFPNPSTPGRDDILWLREEQRWLREEQRWLREEQRWIRERESLLAEIQSLKLQIQALEKRIPAQDVELVPEESIANVRALLHILTEKNRITESASSSTPMALEEDVKDRKKEEKKDSEREDDEARKTLRKGREGDEVREMQEALEKLGFCSGEEDMEFSSFSSGTERAVKTWQATMGAPEDGIMTAELLERLYTEQRMGGTRSTVSVDQKGSTVTVSQKEGANGAAVTSVTEISETQQKVVSEEGVTEVEVSQQRVFLLGENRWEEPSRLIGRDRQIHGSKTNDTMKKCLSCRGEGRLLCTECDGTGEPNIEPQFLEWVDEGAKCPYCEGLGYTICDVCEGKTMVKV